MNLTPKVAQSPSPTPDRPWLVREAKALDYASVQRRILRHRIQSTKARILRERYYRASWQHQQQLRSHMARTVLAIFRQHGLIPVILGDVAILPYTNKKAAQFYKRIA